MDKIKQHNYRYLWAKQVGFLSSFIEFHINYTIYHDLFKDRNNFKLEITGAAAKMSGTHKKRVCKIIIYSKFNTLHFALHYGIVTLSNRSATCLFFRKVKSSPIISSGHMYIPPLTYLYTHAMSAK